MTDETKRDGDIRDADVSRRTVLRLAIGAAVAVPLVDLGAATEALARSAKAAAKSAPAGKFFTPHERALVDELCELIIPSDDHSPGAKAAGVPQFIDGRLAATLDGEHRVEFRSGLRAIDDAQKKKVGKDFLASSHDERIALLTEISKNEFEPKTPEEKAFRAVKEAAAYAYYTSEIGIHKEIEYLGNTFQQGDYAGYDVSPEPPEGGSMS